MAPLDIFSLSLEYSLTILYLLEQKWMETLWVMSEIC